MTFLRYPHNRLRAIIQHIDRFYFQGVTKLAHEAGVSHSAISRICSGKSGASYPVICAITAVLEGHLGKHIDPREIVSFNGEYEHVPNSVDSSPGSALKVPDGITQ